MKLKVIFNGLKPKIALLVIFLVSGGIFILSSCGGGGGSSSSSTTTAISAPTGVALSGLSTTTVGSFTFTSSSKIKVDWVEPVGVTIDHYKIEAVDDTGGATISETVASGVTTLTLEDLKADTTYSITVTAYGNASESVKASAAIVTTKTSTEYWQLQGSGNTVSNLTKIVSDGNARISATRIGSEAGGITANHIQLYYGPSGTSGTSLLIPALSNSAVDGTNITSYTSFTSSMSGSSATAGLASPSTGVGNILAVLTGQGVPLSSSMGGNIRLFFEANGTDGKARIFSVDSVDGYIGHDFNTGTSKVCITTADYSTGGGCKFTIELGVEGDSEKANLKISNARQHKVGWPTLTDWRWDGATGTFMVFTTDSVSGCTTARMNHGYAIWDGSKWVVQYETSGCPKLFNNAQAAFPMHIGGKKYKMYYSDPSITSGRIEGSPLPFPGPKNLIYSDGGLTSTAQVDFEDWESQTKARDVVFIWPDNSMLNAKEEGYIDDYHFLTPTGDLSIQVMYLAITDGSIPPLASSAILLNP
ncbi:fibronectin type III domain-containing protein [Flavobacterium sp.]|uniref:fibronectin type III domain-containing protein n=1 Tax=Flavobacterium sp. TaxID=239 RepID=UPI00374D6AE4